MSLLQLPICDTPLDSLFSLKLWISLIIRFESAEGTVNYLWDSSESRKGNGNPLHYSFLPSENQIVLALPSIVYRMMHYISNPAAAAAAFKVPITLNLQVAKLFSVVPPTKNKLISLISWIPLVFQYSLVLAPLKHISMLFTYYWLFCNSFSSFTVLCVMLKTLRRSW